MSSVHSYSISENQLSIFENRSSGIFFDKENAYYQCALYTAESLPRSWSVFVPIVNVLEFISHIYNILFI